MEFWNSALTEKSWKVLLQLKEKNFDFVVIGGWAAYLWTSLHKSKDVDIAVKDFNDLAFLVFRPNPTFLAKLMIFCLLLHLIMPVIFCIF